MAEKLIATGKISSRELNNAIECCAIGSHLKKYTSQKPTSHFSIGELMAFSHEEWMCKLELLKQNFSTLFHTHSPYVKSLKRYAIEHDLDTVLVWITEHTVVAEKQRLLRRSNRSLSKESDLFLRQDKEVVTTPTKHHQQQRQ